MAYKTAAQVVQLVRERLGGDAAATLPRYPDATVARALEMAIAWAQNLMDEVNDATFMTYEPVNISSTVNDQYAEDVIVISPNTRMIRDVREVYVKLFPVVTPDVAAEALKRIDHGQYSAYRAASERGLTLGRSCFSWDESTRSLYINPVLGTGKVLKIRYSFFHPAITVPFPTVPAQEIEVPEVSYPVLVLLAALWCVGTYPAEGQRRQALIEDLSMQIVGPRKIALASTKAFNALLAQSIQPPKRAPVQT